MTGGTQKIVISAIVDLHVSIVCNAIVVLGVMIAVPLFLPLIVSFVSK
jgi:hypothetical protein